MSSEPPLIIACRNGDCDAIRAVFGALVDQQTDSQKRTPLYVACTGSRNLRIDFGGDDEEEKWDGRVRERSACVRLLLAAGASVDVKCGEDGNTPLQCAVKDRGWPRHDIVAQLIAAGADVEAGPSVWGERAGSFFVLYLAAQDGSADTVARLIAAGANVHRLTAPPLNFGPGYSLMYSATISSNVRVYPHLLRAGAALPSANGCGRCPYLSEIYLTSGGFPAYEREHRRRLTAVFTNKFPMLPVEVVSHIVHLWGHCGDYLYAGPRIAAPASVYRPGRELNEAELAALKEEWAREQAQGWPAIKPNTSGMCKLVYGEMLDYMRKVSTHVTIGKAWKFGKETENYFMLLREDGADLS